MDGCRPRTSRPRKRSEPLVAKPQPPDSKSATEKDPSRFARPQTACFQPKPTSSRNSSGVRSNEKYLSARDSSATEKDSSRFARPQTACFQPKPAGSRNSSGVRSNEKYLSARDSSATEKDSSRFVKPQTACFQPKPTISRNSSGVRSNEKYLSARDSSATEKDSSRFARPQTACFQPKPTSSRNSSGVRSNEKYLSARGSPATEKDSSRFARPQTACFQPKPTSSRNSSGVRSNEKYLSARGSPETATEKNSSRFLRPQTACFQPKPTSSRSSSGVRSNEKYLSARDSSGTETDSDTIKADSPKQSYMRDSSGVRSMQGDEKYFSAFDSTGTETDSETIKGFSLEEFYSTPEHAPDTIDVGDIEYPSDVESDGAETVISIPPKQKYLLPAPPMSFIDVRSTENSYREYSDSDDAKTVVSIAPKQKTSQHPSRRSSGERSERCLKYEAPIVPIINLEGAESVISVPQKQTYLLPAPPMSSTDGRSTDNSYREYSDSDDAKTVVSIALKRETSHHPTRSSGERSERCLKYQAPIVPIINLDGVGRSTDNSYREYPDSDDAKTVESIAPKQKTSRHPSRRSSGERSERCLKYEAPIVPIINLDGLQSVSGKSSVILKSAKGCIDLKLKDPRRRDSSGSRIGEQLKKIDSKNMLFFPSKNLTRPSIEEIYRPIRKRSSSTLRASTCLTLPSSKTTSKDRKSPLELDTPRPAVAKEADNPPVPPTKQTEPKILAPLMVRKMTDKKIDRNNRSNVPGKPKPFMASGCGKGIPSLESLPKPKIGKVPTFILNKKKEAEEEIKDAEEKKKDAGNNFFKSRSLSVLDFETAEIKPAIPSATRKSRKTADNSFTRSRIPLLKGGSKSTSNLTPIKESDRENQGNKLVIGLLKRKKSVHFALPDSQNSPRTDEPPSTGNTTYLDQCKQQYKESLEKPPTFGDGPLPITEPSEIYQALKKKGCDYSQFTPKQNKYIGVPEVPSIPYNFLDKYLEVFDNNLERAAVHTKYGSADKCTCGKKGDAVKFCEQHIVATELQYYQEVAEVMMYILSLRFNIPEYDEAEKMFEENYPYIYNVWIPKVSTKLTMDYSVREAKCKAELVERCSRVLREEDYLAEYLESKEIIGSKRDISISGKMKDVDEDFESSYTFLFKEYPHLFIQLVEKIEFMPLAMERRIVAAGRQDIVKKSKLSEEELQALDEFYEAELQKDVEETL